jgi:copper chaperone CopZ
MGRLKLASIVLAMFLVMGANAQKASSTKVVSIQTNGTCQPCKEKIEQGLAFEKGVKDVEYDLASAIVKVTYNAEKTSVEKLRKAINKLGYSADGQEPEKGKKAACGHSKKGEKHSCKKGDGHKH